MKFGRLGPHNQGSVSFAAMASALSLGLGTLYVMQTSKQTQHAVDAAMVSRASEMGQTSNLSNLGIVRSLLSDRKTPDGRSFEPPVYPVDYFAPEWDLQKNALFMLNNVSPAGKLVRVRSFSPKEANLNALHSVFDLSKSQLSMMTDVQTLEIVDYVRSKTHLDYVMAVDVKAKRKVSVDNPNNKVRDVATYGRIFLTAPIPQNIRLTIRGENEPSFSTNFGTKDKPLKPGKYLFRLEGSGVVHHGQIIINGEINRVGLDNTGRISHRANNVRAQTVLIGDTQLKDFSEKGGRDEDHVNKNGCELDVKNDVTPGSGPGAVNVVAKLIGVDGVEAAKLTITQPVIFGEPEKAGGHGGAIACEDKCPSKEFPSDSLETIASHLDRSLSPKGPGNDIFQSEKTGEVNSKRGRGIVCGNYELVAAEIKARSGMEPSALLRSNREYYKTLLGEVMPLKQYVAYMAPGCKREVVGARDSCGCFKEDTEITMADGSVKLASTIRSGDMVLNPKTGQAQMIRKVIAGPERWPLLSVTAGGKTVTVTGEHPFLTKEGLKPAFKLRPSDILIEGQEEALVEAIDTEKRKEGDKAPEVWNFELHGSSDPDDHYLLANGVMTGDLYLQMKLGGRSAEERSLVVE